MCNMPIAFNGSIVSVLCTYAHPVPVCQYSTLAATSTGVWKQGCVPCALHLSPHFLGAALQLLLLHIKSCNQLSTGCTLRDPISK